MQKDDNRGIGGGVRKTALTQLYVVEGGYEFGAALSEINWGSANN